MGKRDIRIDGSAPVDTIASFEAIESEGIENVYQRDKPKTKKFTVRHRKTQEPMFKTDYDFEVVAETEHDRAFGGEPKTMRAEEFFKNRKEMDMRMVKKIPFREDQLVPGDYKKNRRVVMFDIPDRLREELKEANASRVNA